MRSLTWMAVWAAVLVLPACDQPPAPTEVALTVAALDLPGVTDAVYDIEVLNEAGDVVFQRRISSTAYGNGDGSASYVGPCDSQSNDNTVALTLVELWAGGAQLTASEYKNPGRLERTFTCVANQDVAVSFYLTLIRPANQGFFDIAVTFDNIFCSAKLDCKGADNLPIKLLFDAGGARATTLVVGFACTTGNTSDITTLYRDDLVLTCDIGAGPVSVTVNPEGAGNLPAGNLTGTSGLLFGAAVSRGAENFAFDKQYWNVMLGLVDGTENCRLTTSASAARGYFEFKRTPAGTSYPYILWDNIAVTDAIGELICNKHPVDGTGLTAGVSTEYAPLNATEPFDHLWSTHGIPIQGAGVPGAPRRWADDTVAARCLDYFLPTLPYKYEGATGDGVYRIDPDGPGGADAFETRCDMTNGGWTRVAFEDFESGTTAGWSWYNTVTPCGDPEPAGFGNILWGGTWSGDYSWYTYKGYSWAPVAHTDARLNLDYIKIDSWDPLVGNYDAGYVNFGDQAQIATAGLPGGQVQQLTFATAQGTQVCGNMTAGYNEYRQPVALTLAGHGSAALPNEAWMRASAVLNEVAADESFGVDNVAIWVK